MTTGEWIAVFVGSSGLILGLLNLLFRGPSMGMVERSQYLKNVNESIALANARALEAEKRVKLVEEQLDGTEEKLAIAEKAMGSLLYKISFYATLGLNPTVEHVTIEQSIDRRKDNIKVATDRRNK